MSIAGDRSRPRRSGRAVVALLLALLWIGTAAASAAHHHAGARDACPVCHGAHSAALAVPPSLPGLQPGGRAPYAVPHLHPTAIAVTLRARGPPALLASA